MIKNVLILEKMDLEKLKEKAGKITGEYMALQLYSVADYEKYKLYRVVTSSTSLEGSTLNDIDTQILLDDGIVAAGKPLEHHLMVKDNYEAILYAIQNARSRAMLSPEFLCTLNGINMKTTGQAVNTALGTIDARTGVYRITPAYSIALGYCMSAEKIPETVKSFCKTYSRKMQETDPVQLLQNSFEAHASLIMIHPWYDGNKRTARLVMNCMQEYGGLPLTGVHKSEMEAYILSLKEYKDNNRIDPLMAFMFSQHIKTLKDEIDQYKYRSQGKSKI